MKRPRTYVNLERFKEVTGFDFHSNELVLNEETLYGYAVYIKGLDKAWRCFAGSIDYLLGVHFGITAMDNVTMDTRIYFVFFILRGELSEFHTDYTPVAVLTDAVMTSCIERRVRTAFCKAYGPYTYTRRDLYCDMDDDNIPPVNFSILTNNKPSVP